MLSEEQKLKNERHNRRDKTLAAIVAAVGIAGMITLGVKSCLDQRKAITPYQDDIRTAGELYNPGNVQQKIFYAFSCK